MVPGQRGEGGGEKGGREGGSKEEPRRTWAWVSRKMIVGVRDVGADVNFLLKELSRGKCICRADTGC